MKTLNELASVASDTAMRAAANKIAAAKPELLRDEDCTHFLLDQLRIQVKHGLEEALDDAKEALDMHMGYTAEVTFLASMRLCGIRAANTLLATIELPATQRPF